MLPEPTEESLLPDAVVPVGETVAETGREPFWGYADLAMALGLMVAMVGLILISVASLTFVRPPLRVDPIPILLPAQLGLYLAIYVAFKVTFALRYGRPVFASLGVNRNWTPRLLLMAAVGGLLLSPAVSAIASLLHTPEVKMDILEMLDNSPVILALFGLMAISITPLFEEMLFRGFLQPLLSRTLGAVAGIGVTALLFGALHGPQYMMHWQYIAAVSTVGVALGVVRYKTGSIVTSSVMHACYNLIAVIALVFKHK